MKNTYKQFELAAIGRHMLEMVQTAIAVIRKEEVKMVIETKEAYDGIKWDCVTNADKKAQEMYLEEIQEHFPTFGIIAEEKELTIPCTDPDVDVYFTIDPLDGTKAFARKQSHGVGTMLALVCNGNIVAAYIGDVNTGEVYGYANEELRAEVTRYRFGNTTLLQPDTIRPLQEQYALLRENPRTMTKLAVEMVTPFPEDGALFKDFEITSGSIGLRLARLWKAEVGAMFLVPTHDTPWDLMPVLGICQRLGFKFLRYDEGENDYVEFEPELVRTVKEQPNHIIVIHEVYVETLKEWIKQNK